MAKTFRELHLRGDGDEFNENDGKKNSIHVPPGGLRDKQHKFGINWIASHTQTFRAEMTFF